MDLLNDFAFFNECKQFGKVGSGEGRGLFVRSFSSSATLRFAEEDGTGALWKKSSRTGPTLSGRRQREKIEATTEKRRQQPTDLLNEGLVSYIRSNLLYYFFSYFFYF